MQIDVCHRAFRGFSKNMQFFPSFKRGISIPFQRSAVSRDLYIAGGHDNPLFVQIGFPRAKFHFCRAGIERRFNRRAVIGYAVSRRAKVLYCHSFVLQGDRQFIPRKKCCLCERRNDQHSRAKRQQQTAQSSRQLNMTFHHEISLLLSTSDV